MLKFLSEVIKMAFSDKSRELREEYQLTQAELAKAINLSRSCISMLEIGINEPTANTLIAYSNYFNIPIDELLERDEPTPTEKAAGASTTRRVSITPIEDEMLYAFRRVGKKHGENTQRGVIDMLEKML